VIHKLLITDPSQTPTPWWSKLEALKARDEIEFGPGLNLLLGPNGSGKSTILNLVAHYTFCRQGGLPKVTDSALRELRGKHGAMVVGDGEPCFYFNPEETPGLIGGMAAFDHDFFDHELFSAHISGSSGQNVALKLGRVVKAMRETTPELEFKTRGLEHFQKCLSNQVGTPPPRPFEHRTLLVDEPDRSLDASAQSMVWMHFLKLASHNQIIMAVHSPLVFTLGIEEVFAIKFIGTIGWVSGKRDASPGILTHVTKDHRLDIDGCSPFVWDMVHPTICVGTGIIP